MRIESSEDGNQVSFRVRDRESSGCSGREELSLGMVSFHYINPDPDLQFLEYSCGLCHVGIDSKLLLLLLWLNSWRCKQPACYTCEAEPFLAVRCSAFSDEVAGCFVLDCWPAGLWADCCLLLSVIGWFLLSLQPMVVWVDDCVVLQKLYLKNHSQHVFISTQFLTTGQLTFSFTPYHPLEFTKAHSAYHHFLSIRSAQNTHATDYIYSYQFPQ